ncbi:MAG TPA: M23 family metallopeptidase [Anaerolineae bacterium]|nr:M23 family metallopeptidase [Anaerolineae bacterium]
MLNPLVKPQAGSGGLNLRSTHQVDPSTLLGTLKEGLTLEVVDQSIAGWYACQVFASTQVFVANGNALTLMPDKAAGNLRSAASTDPSTVVGMLKPGQQLELISAAGDWLMAKVYVSAAASDLIGSAAPPPPTPAPVPPLDGFDTPIGSEQERASAQVWPGAWLDLASFAMLFQARPGGPTVCSTGVHLQLPNNGAVGVPVLTTGKGLVRFTGADPNWGNVITIEHPLTDGTRVWSRYAYLDDIIVRPGDNVSRGQLIGHVGNGYGKTSYQLHFDIAKIDLAQNPLDWPGDDQNRVQQNYLDPKAFVATHRPQLAQSSPQPAPQSQPAPQPAPQPQPVPQPVPAPITHAPVTLKLGLHDSEGGDWLQSKQLRGVTLAAVAVQDQPAFVDFTPQANAGLDVILRVNYGWADGTGTIAPPADLAKFEKAAIDTINGAKGIAAAIYCNEINNPQEYPGFNPDTGKPGSNCFFITPDYYVASYNRVYAAVKPGIQLGPAPLDPYFGPQFPWLAFTSDNREWWRAILKGINGAGAFFFHGKTQSNDPAEIRSDKKFDGDPLRWQFLGFRTMETYLAEIPDQFKDVPFYITEANPQRLANGQHGWDPNNAAWITECLAYLKDWNANPANHPVSGVLFYRWANDQWAIQDMAPIRHQIIAEAAKL